MLKMNIDYFAGAELLNTMLKLANQIPREKSV
jgi:hypothetical protein